MVNFLMEQLLILAFALVSFLFIFNKIATPEQKKELIPSLKKFPRRFIYVMGEFIYLVKNKIKGGASENEKIYNISNYRKHSRWVRWRKRR